jgi:hypothetical protein
MKIELLGAPYVPLILQKNLTYIKCGYVMSSQGKTYSKEKPKTP